LYTITIKAPVGAAYLPTASAGGRYYETAYYGCNESYRGADAARYAECYGKREGNNTHYDAGHEVGFKLVERVIFQSRNQFRLEINIFVEIHLFTLVLV